MTRRFLSFLCGDHVVFAAVGFPGESKRTEFTMKIRNLAMWYRLGQDDMTRNDVGHAGLLQVLGEFQQHLRRKRSFSPCV